MADSFTYDSAEEDWDLNTLHVLNSQLEAYLKMVGVLVVFGTVRLPGHFYSCVVSKYLLRENEISFLLL